MSKVSVVPHHFKFILTVIMLVISASFGSRPADAKPIEYSKAAILALQMHDYYQDGMVPPGATESELLEKFLRLEKYDMEEILKDDNFLAVRDRVYASRLFQNPETGFFPGFIQYWGFYSSRYQWDTMAKFFAHFDPNNPHLLKVLSCDFGSVGREFGTYAGRSMTISLIMFEMLKLAPYKGTPAASKLIARLQGEWKKMKEAGPGLKSGYSPYEKGLFAMNLLKVLNEQGTSADQRIQNMAAEIPGLLKAGIIGSGGQFQSGSENDFYAEALKKHPDVFHDAYLNDPYMKALWFYNQSDEFRSHNREAELKILNWFIGIGKYNFEDVEKSKEWQVIFPKLFTSPLWNQPSNKLLYYFINSTGFYTFSYDTDNMGLLLAGIDSNDPTLRTFFSSSFSASGSGFKEREDRVAFTNRIMVGMLRAPQMRGTQQGLRLLDRVASAWREVKYKWKPTFTDLSFASELQTLLDVPEWRNNRDVRAMVLEAYREAQKRGANDSNQWKYELYAKEYPSLFTPGIPANEATCREMFK